MQPRLGKSGIRARMMARRLLCGILVSWASVLGLAHAEVPLTQLSSEFPINHADPVASVPSVAQQNARPLEFCYFIQDLAAFAAAAGKSGDHLAEARYYRAFAKAVPDESFAFTKLCEALEAGGRLDDAIAACRDALVREGVEVKDYARFVHLVLAKPAGPNGADGMTAEQSEDVAQVIDHLRGAPDTRVAGTVLQCEVAMRKQDLALWQACSAELQRSAPQDPATISFAWALAVRRHDEPEARRLVALAKSSGVRPDGVARMERATDALGWRGWLLDRRNLIAALVVALAASTCLFVWRRRSVRRSLRQQPV